MSSSHKINFIKNMIDIYQKDVSSHILDINITNIRRMNKIFECLVKSGNPLLPCLSSRQFASLSE